MGSKSSCPGGGCLSSLELMGASRQGRRVGAEIRAGVEKIRPGRPCWSPGEPRCFLAAGVGGLIPWSPTLGWNWPHLPPFLLGSGRVCPRLCKALGEVSVLSSEDSVPGTAAIFLWRGSRAGVPKPCPL